MITPTQYAMPVPPVIRDTEREAERRSLASDLHDGPAQSLAYAAIQMQTARGQISRNPAAARAALEQAEAAVRDTLRQVRDLMAGLRPLEREDDGLVSSLLTVCRSATERGRLAVSVRINGEERPMPAWREHALFRAVREAVLNAEQHSGGRRIAVTLDYGPDAVVTSIVDDGSGIRADTEDRARRAGRMGLASMRERLAALGGRMEMELTAARGACVVLTCPYDDDGLGG